MIFLCSRNFKLRFLWFQHCVYATVDFFKMNPKKPTFVMTQNHDFDMCTSNSITQRVDRSIHPIRLLHLRVAARNNCVPAARTRSAVGVPPSVLLPLPLLLLSTSFPEPHVPKSLFPLPFSLLLGAGPAPQPPLRSLFCCSPATPTPAQAQLFIGQ